MPFTTLQQTFNYGDVVHFFSFTAKNGIPVSDIEPKVIKMLKERNSIAPNDSEGVGHVNVEAQFKHVITSYSIHYTKLYESLFKTGKACQYCTHCIRKR